MSTIRKILVPTDFSLHADEAFHVAHDLAKATGAGVVVFHVSRPPAVMSDGDRVVSARAEATDVWDRLRKIQPTDPAVRVEHEVIVANRPDASQILRILEERGCDLIVMGTHGRSGLRHLIFGSLTEDVVRKAECPVMVVKAPVHEAVAPARPTARTARVEDHNMSESLPEIYLARHGETAWTISRQHTGRTDLPLTARGEDNAWGLHDRLRGLAFDRVFVSPLRRARQTCLLAGFAEPAICVADLTEWDYGDYEGLTTAQIRRERPGWSLFRDGCPGGESVAAVGARADRIIKRLRLDAGPRPDLRPRPFLPRAGRALGGAAAGRRQSLRARNGRAVYPGLRARAAGSGHPPLERRSSRRTCRPGTTRRRRGHRRSRSKILDSPEGPHHMKTQRATAAGPKGKAAAQPAVTPAQALARSIRMRAGRVLRDARRLLRTAAHLRPRRPSGAVRRAPALRGRGLGAPRFAVATLAEDR